MAIEWLSERGSLKTARRLLEEVHTLSALEAAEEPGTDVNNSLTAIGQALRNIVLKEREEIVPLLTATLKVKPGGHAQPNQVRIGAANWLKALGPDAHQAVPALREALNETDGRFRTYVAEALEKIQGESSQRDQQR